MGKREEIDKFEILKGERSFFFWSERSLNIFGALFRGFFCQLLIHPSQVHDHSFAIASLDTIFFIFTSKIHLTCDQTLLDCTRTYIFQLFYEIRLQKCSITITEKRIIQISHFTQHSPTTERSKHQNVMKFFQRIFSAVFIL